MPQDYLPVLFQVLIAFGFAISTLTASVIFGRSAKRNATKDTAYECGMLPVGEGAPRFSIKFYLVALVSMAGFAGILVFAYVYALKKGALNWKS